MSKDILLKTFGHEFVADILCANLYKNRVLVTKGTYFFNVKKHYILFQKLFWPTHIELKINNNLHTEEHSHEWAI